MKSIAVVVGTTPTLIAEGGTVTVPKAVALQVPVAAAGSVFVGGFEVSTLTGIEVEPDGEFTIDLKGDSLFAVVASGTQSVRVLRQGT